MFQKGGGPLTRGLQSALSAIGRVGRLLFFEHAVGQTDTDQMLAFFFIRNQQMSPDLSLLVSDYIGPFDYRIVMGTLDCNCYEARE